jgi:hypothetical protein
MKKLLTSIVLLVTFISNGKSALLTIEADDYPAGTNLTQTIEDCEIFAEGLSDKYDVFAFEAPLSIDISGNRIYPAGYNVLGYEHSKYGAFAYWADNPKLRINFNGLAKSVYFEAVCKYASRSGKFFIRGYDENNKQILNIGRQSTSETEPRNIHYSFDDYCLSYVRIYAEFPTMLDHLQFEYQVPEPSTMSLLLLGWLVRRKNQRLAAKRG